MFKEEEILEELLRFNESSDTKTKDFKYSHDELCEIIQKKLIILGESFIKYRSISYVVQGPRDQGVDVLLKISPDDYEEFYIGMQVKSYNEIDDKKNDVSKQLKAGLVDAVNHYDKNLKRYYILLCCDSKRHAKRVSAITNEFSKNINVRVIGPRYFSTFIDMPEYIISAVVDSFLRGEDFIRKSAKQEASGYSDTELFAILTCLSWALEDGKDFSSEDFYSELIDEVSSLDSFDEDIFSDEMDRLMNTVFEIYAEPASTRFQVESFPAIRALYFDVQVRYRFNSEKVISYLFEFLRL